jgi:hypothetical protein
MKFIGLVLVTLIVGCSGCKDCNKGDNPITKDYPCGQRAHACSVQPLTCCWNSQVCGGPAGTGCPPAMCCYVGESDMASPSASPSAAPGAKQEPQWSLGVR